MDSHFRRPRKNPIRRITLKAPVKDLGVRFNVVQSLTYKLYGGGFRVQSACDAQASRRATHAGVSMRHGRSSLLGGSWVVISL